MYTDMVTAHARTVQIAALAAMFVQIVVDGQDGPLEVPGVGGQHHHVSHC